MATHTPNLNLYKPDSTDDYADFREEFNSNMDKIDQGGGGSGGHTYLNVIYSTEEKKIGYWTDGKPLYQRTVHISALPSSATSQQYAHNIPDIDTICHYQSISRASSGSSVIMNRVAMNGSSLNGSASYDVFVNKTYITISVGQDRSTNEADVTIQYTKTTDTPELNPQAGGVIYLPTIYSEEEREIGVWRNGKPLYQRILTLTQDTALVADTWVKTEFNKDTMETLVRVYATIGTLGAIIEALSGGFVDGKLALNSARNVGLNVSNNVGIIVQYTKTTDTAGSGSWTSSGASAIHYSTNEQVVGTWVDGKPLYQKTINITTPSVANTNVSVADITSLNIETVVSLDGNYKDTNINWSLNIFFSSVRSSNCFVNGGKTAIMMLVNDNAAISKNAYVTIKYTKTTD